MGCDIHMFAEYKVKKLSWYVNGEKKFFEPFWTKFEEVFKNIYFNPTFPVEKWNHFITDEVYNVRNYILFAFLGDVRNDNNIKPISQPRGLPADVSEDVKNEMSDWGGHSASWFTLKELDKANWNQIIKLHALLKDKEMPLFKRTNRPPKYYGFRFQSDKVKYTKVEYESYLYEHCEEFFHALGDLRSLARKNKLKPSEIRIVFFFDN